MGYAYYTGSKWTEFAKYKAQMETAKANREIAVINQAGNVISDVIQYSFESGERQQEAAYKKAITEEKTLDTAITQYDFETKKALSGEMAVREQMEIDQKAENRKAEEEGRDPIRVKRRTVEEVDKVNPTLRLSAYQLLKSASSAAKAMKALDASATIDGVTANTGGNRAVAEADSFGNDKKQGDAFINEKTAPNSLQSGNQAGPNAGGDRNTNRYKQKAGVKPKPVGG